MAPSKIADEQLMARLNCVFRTHGYEGASLTRISEAVGLGRASLYHRFRGGKTEMVEAVLAHAEGCMQKILAPLKSRGPLRGRVQSMAELLDEFYEGGHRGCLFETLTLGDEENSFRPLIKQAFNDWLQALAALAREAGLSEGEARRRAEQALVGIQGGLVFARASGDTGPFHRVLKELPDLLLGP
jgi:TetR/AcrR family transcriptional regulator, lmrAB and yxaGH operons repressor